METEIAQVTYSLPAHWPSTAGLPPCQLHLCIERGIERGEKGKQLSLRAAGGMGGTEYV
jgi:hypothetical protein